MGEVFRGAPEILSSSLLGEEKTTYERLVELNSFMLEQSGESCFEHRYEDMIRDMSNVTWSSSAGVGGRQWFYQVRYNVEKN